MSDKVLLTRIEILNALKGHPMIGKDFTKLNKAEIAWVENFIKTNAPLGLDKYAEKVNRLSVTDEVVRPKNRCRVWALLLEAVTLEFKVSQELKKSSRGVKRWLNNK